MLGDPVLDGTGRVEVLALGEDLNLLVERVLREVQERGAADELAGGDGVVVIGLVRPRLRLLLLEVGLGLWGAGRGRGEYNSVESISAGKV